MSDNVISLNDLSQWLPEVCEIAYQAGRQISKMYHQVECISVEKKSDGSPVTAADKLADDLIYQALQALTPNIPLITEESIQNVAFETRKNWSTYWLVDPLDGTKEFIGGTGEFSVNIALIQNHQSILGVVYGPELGELYFSIKGKPAYKVVKLVSDSDVSNWPRILAGAEIISVSPVAEDQAIRVAVSRRHGGMITHFMSKLGKTERVTMGSALKVCLVAEGKADIYPRFGPTSLWDTAASQCILESAGGMVVNAAGHSLQYVQTESLLNPFFIAVGDRRFSWPSFPEVL